jgi:hypothetical protein
MMAETPRVKSLLPRAQDPKFEEGEVLVEGTWLERIKGISVQPAEGVRIVWITSYSGRREAMTPFAIASVLPQRMTGRGGLEDIMDNFVLVLIEEDWNEGRVWKMIK